MVDILNAEDDNFFLYYKCPPNFYEDEFGNCQPLAGVGGLLDSIFIDPPPTPIPPTPPIPPIPPYDPIINPDLEQDESTLAPPLPAFEEEIEIIPVENTITIYDDDGRSLTITEAEAISAGIITAGGILVKTGSEAYNSYTAYQEGLAKRVAEEEGVEMTEEAESRALAEGEGELMEEGFEEGEFAFEEGAEFRYAYEEPTEGLFEDDALLEGEEGLELTEATAGAEELELAEGTGELFEGGEVIFEGGETAIEMAEITEETALLVEEGGLATEIALESAGLGAEMIGLESIAMIGAEASVVAPYVAPIIIVGTAIALLGYVLYSIFGKRKKQKKTRTETTYEEQVVDVPIIYEENVSELQPDERRELLQAMKDNNENGQFDSSIEKLESGQRIILSTYADGSQSLTYPLNTTQLEGLPKFLDQNPEYFYGMDSLYLQALGVNPDLADPNKAPDVINSGDIYGVYGKQAFRFDELEQGKEDKDAIIFGEWSEALQRADYLYANREITLEEYNQIRQDAMDELAREIPNEAKRETTLAGYDFQNGLISADEYVEILNSSRYYTQTEEFANYSAKNKEASAMYQNKEITYDEYQAMLRANRDEVINGEPTELADYEYQRLVLELQFSNGDITYDEYVSGIDDTIKAEITDYSYFSDRLGDEQMLAGLIDSTTDNDALEERDNDDGVEEKLDEGGVEGEGEGE